jgi:hypothetical protein
MSTTQPSTPSTDAAEPVAWAGIAAYPGDMNNREILCFGTRVKGDLTIERAFHLTGWKPVSLVESLLQGPSAPSNLEELKDLTGLVPVATFDLPAGAGIGQALFAFQQAARGFGSVLERVATAQVGFHLVPRLLDRLWRELSGGNPVWVRHYQAVLPEREMLSSGGAWRKGTRVAYAASLEQQNGPRHQLFGHNVLEAELGMCPECGSSMVKGPDGKAMCELELLKTQVVPTEVDITAVAAKPEVQAALAAEFAGIGEVDELYADPGVTWDETV